MTRLLLALALLGLRPPAAAAAPDPPVPLIEIDLTPDDALGRLAGLGLDLVAARPGLRAFALGWPGTEALLDGAGLCHVVADPDYGRTLALRSLAVRPTGRRTASAAGAAPPFGEGSLGGFWTYAEVCALLDSLATDDPLGITSDLDTVGVSVEGRPILALALRSETAPEGSRPEVLLTGLVHAREPESMQSVLRVLLHLRENYGVDPEATYLVNERETWFVPVMNPDGYVRNESTWVATGAFGLWRKNVRDNNGDGRVTNADGVDLNRNFGFEWGHDNTGSSPNPMSPTYRGPAPFSEPETAGFRDFCAAHAFVVAENAHSYQEAVLYPWAYMPANCPDSTFFIGLSDRITAENRYAYGTSDQILYPVNGDADDWMYGDVVTKPRAFALTAEIGNQADGFWPTPDRIAPLADLNLRFHLDLVRAAGTFLAAESLEVAGADPWLAPGETAGVTCRVRHLGAGVPTGGGVVATMASTSPWIEVLDDVAAFPDIGPGEGTAPAAGDGFTVRVDPMAPPGLRVALALTLEDGAGYFGRDTLSVRIGVPEVAFEERGDGGLAAWTAEAGWGIESVDGDPALSDSPGDFYPDGSAATLTLRDGFDLSGAAAAALRFRARWDIEIAYDFGLVEASADSGLTWTPLAGAWTTPGRGMSGVYTGGTQPAGVPGYHGTRRLWTEEEADLAPFVGAPDVRIRFRLLSDSGVRMDGWLVDDIEALVYAPASPLAAGPDPVAAPPVLSVLPSSPNPFRQETRITVALASESEIAVAVLDVRGRRVRTLAHGVTPAGETRLSWDGRTDDGRPAPAGVYFVRAEAAGGAASSKVVVVR